MFHKILGPWALLVSGLVLFQTASASDLPQVSFNQLTDNSELIVSGTITRSWAEWDAEHKYIWTHYELAVTAAHKGAPARTLDIAEPGGQLDGMLMNISGATGYAVGDNVLVFLSRMPNGYLRTAGFGAGKYTVAANGRIHGDVALKAPDTVTPVSAGAVTEIRTLNDMTVSEASQLIGARVRASGGRAK